MNNCLLDQPRLSHRMQRLRPSCIRDILKAAGSHHVISFAGGLPNPRLFPIREIEEATRRVLQSEGRHALQYSSSEGYEPLRRYVATVLLPKRGITATADQILITNGSQQGLDLVGKVFLDRGDVVIMESPAYLSAIQAFELYQPRLHGIPLREDGVDPGELAKSLFEFPEAKLYYAVPNFQNPTGRCYSEPVRKVVAELLDAGDTLLVEDDPYRELRFEGEDMKPIHAYARRTGLLMGTFSKVLSPGLRMGWIYSRPEIIRHLEVAKQATDLCSSDLTQRVLYELLTEFDLDAHIARLRATYREQRDHMIRLIAALFPEGTEYTRPQGGMFIWMTLPGGVSADRLLAATSRRGVVFAPGKSFFPTQPREDALRLNFSHTEGPAMEKGMRIMAEELKRLETS